MEDEELSNVNVDEIINELLSENTQPTLPPTGDLATDMATEQKLQYGDGVAVPIPKYLLYTPSVSSSKSKNNNVLKKKEIKELLRAIRPYLPRKAKSDAYILLQNIAKGIVVKSSFQQRIKKKKPKKRPVPKQKTRQLKKKSLSIVRRNDRTLYGSSDSCRSNTSCAHCSHSCFRFARC